MFVDKGLNDQWVRPQHLRRVGRGHYVVTVKEQLGQQWEHEVVSYPLPRLSAGSGLQVRLDGVEVPCQLSGATFSFLVEHLLPGEERSYEITTVKEAPPVASTWLRISETDTEVEADNGLLDIKAPASTTFTAETHGQSVPGPLLAVRRSGGTWLGQGRLDSPISVTAITTRLTENGPLWATLEVAYTFADESTYRVQLILRPRESCCEVREESTLPVRLWPAPRPNREIGSLGTSFWGQGTANIGKPCTRPCPTSNFIFDLRAGFQPDRLVTHSTASWEIMDLPLGAADLRTYTAMRPALPSIDGGWMGVYDSQREELFGVVPLDICHWKTPDETIHPAHRTPGANSEVILVDGDGQGSHLRFPIENLTRHWLIAVYSRRDDEQAEQGPITHSNPIRREPDVNMPLWALRTHRADLPLNKVKDWVLEWPDSDLPHPRVLCDPDDFPAIRQKVASTPELRQYFTETSAIHSADRYLMTGEASGLAAIEAATHGKAIVEGILLRGYVGPSYCIALARPMRRYALACDIQWASFTPAEKREARWVCALAAYILSDGDWWQYTFRPNETTYLPNFNSDVFTCAGIIGMFLADHPCATLWTRFLVTRMDIEVRHHLRLDGGGEENVGNYLISTWTQLLLPALWALRHCGIKDYSTDPHVLAGARFLLKILGPPDVRDDGIRMTPPIGHHPGARKCPMLFAWLAGFLKDADPELAANLMWAWQAVGSPVGNGIDHSGPAANPFTRQFIFHDPTITAVALLLESYNLQHVGAVLRSHAGGEGSSYLFLKAGRVHSHHEDDEGSFHYFGRGVPLALDGLPLCNIATAAQHNAVSFARHGQPSGLVEHFTTTPTVDYIRARIAPRAFACDAMYLDDTHRSGFIRELVLVKSPAPGGIEYLVVKDTATGPDACQWNLDVLSRRPSLDADGVVRFPGHPDAGFNMGLEVHLVEPAGATVTFEEGPLNERLKTAEGRATLAYHEVNWDVTEHWLLHIPAVPGTTFLTVLFPRRPDEVSPHIQYLAREETLSITHGEGRDLLFLRPNPAVGTSIDGINFRGRAGFVRRHEGRQSLVPLDADHITTESEARKKVRQL